MTSMKRLVLLATFLIAGVATADGKGATGIYLTAEDYTTGQLASEGDCGARGHRVELHDVLGKSFIDVTHDGKTQKYEKRQLYGFRSCDGKDYRFVDNDEYEILESLGVSIYERELPTQSPKDAARGLPRGFRYFFSVGAGGQVVPLTVENLKRAFPDNHAFHDALDMMFHSNDDLTRYDTFHKMFKVNRLLTATATRPVAQAPGGLETHE